MRARVAYGLVGLAFALTGCGGGGSPAALPAAPTLSVEPTTPASTEPATTEPEATEATSTEPTGTPFPIACGTAVTVGDPSSVPAGAVISLRQIGTAVGFTVTRAMPVPNSAVGSFRGYEGCDYQFDTPAGGGGLQIHLVLGTDPVTGKSAAADFADVRTNHRPLSEVACTGSGCPYQLTPAAGLGDAALTGKDTTGFLALIILQGNRYLEVSHSDLKQSRMQQLARLILNTVH